MPRGNLSKQSTEPTNLTHAWRRGRNETQAILLGGGYSHHCANLCELATVTDKKAYVSSVGELVVREQISLWREGVRLAKSADFSLICYCGQCT